MQQLYLLLINTIRRRWPMEVNDNHVPHRFRLEGCSQLLSGTVLPRAQVKWILPIGTYIDLHANSPFC